LDLLNSVTQTKLATLAAQLTELQQTSAQEARVWLANNFRWTSPRSLCTVQTGCQARRQKKEKLIRLRKPNLVEDASV